MDAGASHTTAYLIDRLQDGDLQAREHLFARCLPLLRHWAHGRLPAYARDLTDTNDLVQVTLLRALNRIDEFRVAHQGSFLAYLRSILLNALRDEIRRTGRRGQRATLHEAHLSEPGVSQVEQLVGEEELAQYEAALSDLPRPQQEVLILRIEFGLSFPEIGEETGRSADAARMLFNRAHARLSQRLDQSLGGSA